MIGLKPSSTLYEASAGRCITIEAVVKGLGVNNSV